MRKAAEFEPAARPSTPSPGPEGNEERATGSRLVEYADGDSASPFAQMLGGLIEANVSAGLEKQSDFRALRARVGIEVVDIDEAVTLDFVEGRLTVYNGLKPNRAITISGDSETVMQLSNLRVGLFGLPVIDSTSREVVTKVATRRLRIDGLPLHALLLNRLTRVFSVR
jgi:hypothetical protein